MMRTKWPCVTHLLTKQIELSSQLLLTLYNENPPLMIKCDLYKARLEQEHAPIRVVTFVEFLYGLTRAASNGQAHGDTLRDELENTVWPESKKKVYS